MRRAAWIVLVGSFVGCGLGVVGVDVDAPATFEEKDGGTASLPEAAPPSDASLPDVVEADAENRPDAGVPFAPSHVSPAAYFVDGPDRKSLIAIDTSAMTLDDGAGPVTDALFVVDGELAVLSTRDFHVNVPLTVSGNRPLVVVAVGATTIEATIQAGAKTTFHGPGGGDAGTGPGAGRPGLATGTSDFAGGGGAGHGSLGAEGAGTSTPGNDGGVPGLPYNANGNRLVGGSGGGAGVSSPLVSCAAKSRGGAGGGAVQISGVGAIVVTLAGRIHASGGGGVGGCQGGSGAPRGGGGGGGSGGLVYLESIGGITLQPGSVLTANGGGGGQGSDNNTAGDDGSDGLLVQAMAPGGTNPSAGGFGGAGGSTFGLTPIPGFASLSVLASGGGGGATGRIFLRTRTSPALQGGVTSAIVVSEMGF